MKGTNMNELEVVAQDNKLGQTQVEMLLSNFGQAYRDAKELADGASSIVVTQEDQNSLMKEARTKRLALKAVRVEVENTRKSLKEQSLREGKAIDGMANIIKALIVPVEEHLEKQEKFAELKQAERIATRHAARIEKLSAFVPDVSLYALEAMTDEAFDNLVTSSKEALDAQLKAEAKAEADKVAAQKEIEAEQERLRLENIGLKEEATKHDAEIEAERKKREEIERGIEQLRKEEATKVAAKEEASRKALLAPDKDKLLNLADALDSVVIPNVESREAGVLLDETKDFLDRIVKNLRNKAKAL